MDNIINRKLLKAKRRNRCPTYENDNTYKSKTSPDLISLHRISDNTTKNSNPSTIYHSVPSASKFSANDRLKKYRESLENKKNEIVKVHQAFNSGTYSSEKGAANKRTLTQEAGKSEQCCSNDICSKKRKTIDVSHNTSDEHIDGNKHTSITKADTVLSPKTKTLETNCETTCTDINYMDWSPIDQDEVVTNIQKFRESQKNDSFVPEYSDLENATVSRSISSGTATENRILYVVTDTNIFISHLNIVQDMLTEECNCIVYVPWIVIQELDYFKDGRAGSSVMLKTAKKAIRFINDQLVKEHSRLKGQTVKEALCQKGSSSNADDNIIFCCIQLVQTSKAVILLSNDVNLRNKALINNITSFGPKNILSKLKDINKGTENKQKLFKINSILSNMCTEIILTEMEEAYGSVLYKLITKPPWDLKQCLTYIKRFWSPVFSLLITQKQCLKIIEDLLKFIETCNDLTTEDNMEEFIKLCLSLCVYFKNCLNKYQTGVISCIKNIQEIVS